MAQLRGLQIRHRRELPSLSPLWWCLPDEKDTDSSAQPWEDYWAMQYGDGEITWGPDPALTPEGIRQAQAVQACWRAEKEAGAPLAAGQIRWYAHSLSQTRTCRSLTAQQQAVQPVAADVPDARGELWQSADRSARDLGRLARDPGFAHVRRAVHQGEHLRQRGQKHSSSSFHADPSCRALYKNASRASSSSRASPRRTSCGLRMTGRRTSGCRSARDVLWIRCSAKAMRASKSSVSLSNFACPAIADRRRCLRHRPRRDPAQYAANLAAYTPPAQDWRDDSRPRQSYPRGVTRQ